jgi:hypothetical protein
MLFYKIKEYSLVNRYQTSKLIQNKLRVNGCKINLEERGNSQLVTELVNQEKAEQIIKTLNKAFKVEDAFFVTESRSATGQYRVVVRDANDFIMKHVSNLLNKAHPGGDGVNQWVPKKNNGNKVGYYADVSLYYLLHAEEDKKKQNNIAKYNKLIESKNPLIKLQCNIRRSGDFIYVSLKDITMDMINNLEKNAHPIKSAPSLIDLCLFKIREEEVDMGNTPQVIKNLV